MTTKTCPFEIICQSVWLTSLWTLFGPTKSDKAVEKYRVFIAKRWRKFIGNHRVVGRKGYIYTEGAVKCVRVMQGLELFLDKSAQMVDQVMPKIKRRLSRRVGVASFLAVVPRDSRCLVCSDKYWKVA